MIPKYTRLAFELISLQLHILVKKSKIILYYSLFVFLVLCIENLHPPENIPFFEGLT
jgi:hypothetical protein